MSEVGERLRVWAEEHSDESTSDYVRQNHVADCLDAVLEIQILKGQLHTANERISALQRRLSVKVLLEVDQELRDQASV